MSLRPVVIADDEPLARDRLRRMLERHPSYEIVAECGEGQAAVEAILAHKPYLLFLDIKMPGLDGFEVLTAIDDLPSKPAVVFVTAFENFARQAFDVSAADYLLKPFDAARFDQALSRAEGRHGANTDGALDPALRTLLESLRIDRSYPERFLVRGPTHLYFVRADEIEWVDAQGNYVRLHVGGRAHFVRDTMKEFETKLNPDRFLRVHRSIIINIEHVQRLEPHGHGEYVITLRDGSRVTSSRAHGDRLHALLR